MKQGMKTIDYIYRHKMQNAWKEMTETAKADLPELNRKTDATTGAGIMGDIELPTPGQYENMKLTISYRTSSEKFERATAPGVHEIELSTAVQVLDRSNGSDSVQYVKYSMKGYCVASKPGTVETGKESDASAEYNLIYYKKTINGIVAREVDKLNGVDRVFENEYYQDIMNNL